MSAGTAVMAEKTRTIRISPEALRVAQIASGYTGESVADYICRILIERGNEDIERLHAERHKQPPHKPKGKG